MSEANDRVRTRWSWSAPQLPASLLAFAATLGGCAITHPPGPSCAQFADTSLSPPATPSHGLAPPVASGESPAPPVAAAVSEPEDPAGLLLKPSRGPYTRAVQRLLRPSGPPPTPGAPVQAQPPRVLNLLLISGGGQWGAYGSGFLNGIYADPAAAAAAGEVPLGDYNDLTGISTGGLMLVDVWSAVIHARRHEAAEATASLSDLKAIYSHTDPDLFKTENALVYTIASNGLLDPKGRLETLLQQKIAAAAPLFATDQTTQVEVGAVNLANGQFYSFQMPEVVRAGALPCFSEILLASAAIPLAFPPRYMDGAPYVDGGIRYLTYADRLTADLAAEKKAGRPVTLNIRVIVNGNQSVNDPGKDAAQALACDGAGPGDVSRCPPVANTLLGSFLGGSSGKGLALRVTQDVFVHQVKLDSVYRLYTRWKQLGLPGSFRYTYVSNSELVSPPAAAGVKGACQTPKTSSAHFDKDFQGCLYAIGLAKGAAHDWSFSESQ